MKKLVLYFLFFVAAALILVQCAKFFPSENKLDPHTSVGGKKTNLTGNVISKKSALKASSTFSSLPEDRNSGLHLPVKQPSFTLNMVNFIRDYEFLSYQYWGVYHHTAKSRRLFHDSLDNFLFTGLWSNNRGGLMAINEPDFRK